MGQQNRKTLPVTAKIGHLGVQTYYSAKVKLVNTKIVTGKFGNKRSVANFTIYGTLEGNLCGDNRVTLTKKANKMDYNAPVTKRNIELTLVSYKQHYGRQSMTIGSNLGPSFCLAYSKPTPFAMRVSFDGHIDKETSKGKSAVFNVILHNRKDQKSLKFQVTFNGKKNEWKLREL